MSLSKYSFDFSTTKVMPVGIRKRSREDNASVHRDSQAEQEVDDVFETEEAKFDVEFFRAKKIKANNAASNTSWGSDIQKLTSEHNYSNSRVFNLPCGGSCSSPVVIRKSEDFDFAINHNELVNSDDVSDVNSNVGDKMPLTIATPEQINSRSLDKEVFMTPQNTPTVNHSQEFMTPNSSVNLGNTEVHKENCDTIVEKMVGEIIEAFENNVETTGTVAVTTNVLTNCSNRSLITVAPSCPNTDPVNEGKCMTYSKLSKTVKTPDTTLIKVRPAAPCPKPRPPTKLVQPRVMKPPGPRFPFKPAPPRASLPSKVAPKIKGSIISGGSSKLKCTMPRAITKQISSKPYPVVLLDDTPPVKAKSTSPPSSVRNKLSSLGVSIAKEKFPGTQVEWVPPPGLDITKVSSKLDEVSSVSLLDLGRAFSSLAQGNGMKRLVQFKLTEEQVQALTILGLKEEEI